jgi:alginate O-acetyltransferase complex protein AlgI
MLLNSYTFIFLFLPITFAVYFILHRGKLSYLAKPWLIMASLFFYGYWNPVYLPLIFSSILFNYFIGFLLNRNTSAMPASKRLLVIGIAGNLILLAYFKYMDFFIVNINTLSSLNLPLTHVMLPLGISFFTFTQIAYLVDTYRGTTREGSLLNYILFVTFFPRLAAGPIVRYQEKMPQFEDHRNKTVHHKHIAEGLVLFSLGLFKKVVIADTLSEWVNAGFDLAPTLGLIEAWITSLSYTLQIYYDFSGYTDMALGAALLFNIRLPINFNSPYQAHDIQEFWRRWHMTLSRFVRDYIYIPLGGSRGSEFQTVLHILFTFFLVGLWHGAGWTFVTWGILHGVAWVGFHFWQKTSWRLPKFIAWIITFNFVNIAWIFFRAQTFSDAWKVLKGMMGLSGVIFPEIGIGLFTDLKQYGIQFGDVFPAIQWNSEVFFWFFIGFFLAGFFRNSNELAKRFQPSWRAAVIFSGILMYAISHLQKTGDFIYFNF